MTTAPIQPHFPPPIFFVAQPANKALRIFFIGLLISCRKDIDIVIEV